MVTAILVAAAMALNGACDVALAGQAYQCIVSSGGDDGANGATLRFALEVAHGTNGGCAGPADADASFFGSVVLFSTDQVGTIPVVQTVTLTHAILVGNPSRGVVVGNWNLQARETAGVAYPAGYWDGTGDAVAPPKAKPADGNWGTITIDASGFSGAPFVCKSGASPVYLRNLVVRTKGLTKTQMLAASPCLRDAGALQVIP